MKLKCEMLFAHATMRPEKSGDDDGPVASDIKLTGTVLADKLVDLFSSEEAYNRWLGKLYDGKDAMKCKDVSAVELSTDLEKVSASIGSALFEDEKLVFTGCKFNNVVLRLKDDRVIELSCRLQAYPADEQWSMIRQLLRKPVSVSITGGKDVEPKAEKQGKLAIGKDDDEDAGDRPGLQ